jgi:protein SCO1/2
MLGFIPNALTGGSTYPFYKELSMTTTLRRSLPWLIIATIFTFSIGVTLGHVKTPQNKSAAPQTQMSGTILPTPRALNAFTLTDDHNQPFTNQNLMGHWTFLFFGFTNCAHMCPMTMTTLKDMYGDLKQAKQSLPQVVLISIDPQRDTVQRLHQFVTAFDPAFQGARGSEAQIEALSQELSILYMKVKAAGQTQQQAQDYQIDHSGTLLLINPKGQLYAIFSMPHDAKQIAKDFEMIATS